MFLKNNKKMILLMWLMCALSSAASVPEGGSRYMFYRDMAGAGAGAGARRMFGGQRAAEDAWPAACVLLDRYWAARCSGSVVAARWALTAAHCVTPRLAYVKYGTTRPAGPDTRHTAVLYLYRHPEYRVVQEDLGRGMDVTLLHHDVGLVRTRSDMRLRAETPLPELRSIATYTLKEVKGEIVEVLGFGRTETAAQGDELVSARLRVVGCERSTWVPCMCGAAEAGVCAGDSGGPVVYRGVQLAVTSMGPVECARPAPAAGAPEPRARALDPPTSVFTALSEYAPLINATILDTDDALRMRRIAPYSGATATATAAATATVTATATATTIATAALIARCY